MDEDLDTLSREQLSAEVKRLLDGEIFYTLREAQVVIESWWRRFYTVRPHGSLGYKTPAPEVSCLP